MRPLVLLPGMMCDARVWSPQIAALSGSRALHLAALSEHDNVEALATTILANAPVRFALAGISLGGAVALEMVRQSPFRVERLALIDTNPEPATEIWRARREARIAQAMTGKLERVLRDEVRRDHLATGAAGDHAFARFMEMALDLGPDVYARQSRAQINRPEQRDALGAYRGQTLILIGETDRLGRRGQSAAMLEAAPGARLAVLEGAGRLPTLEQPDRTTSELLSWLAA